MDDDYNNEYDDENASSAREDNQVQKIPPSMEKTWAVLSADIGDRTTIPCPVRNKGGNVILWYKGATVLVQEDVVLVDRFQVDKDFSLIIPNVSASDQGDYTCKLHPSELLSSSQLNVKQPPSVTITDGSRDLIDRTMTYREGEKIRLVCQGVGYPVPTIHWDTKHHRLHDLPGVIVSKGELIIENAESHHSGIYECHAENEQKQTALGSVHVVIECE